MDTNRASALAGGNKTYIGPVCKKDEDHGDERYASSGRCVVCAAETSRAQREASPKKKKRTMSEREVQDLLLAFGPNSPEMAEAAGLDWYNRNIGCPNLHTIVTLDGEGCAQPGCGWRKPIEAEALSKEALDLLG